SKAGPPGARATEREALREPAAGRAGNRQLARGTRRLAPSAPGRRDRENDARRGGGKALERRFCLMPRAKRRGASSDIWTKPRLWGAGRRRGADAGARECDAKAGR